MKVADGYRKRMDKVKNRFEQQFVEPITVHQVSNMLHVLFNERPVASHRDCLYPKVDYIFEKAMDSFIKLTDAVGNGGQITITNSKNVEYNITETIKTSKAVYNSWNPSPQINWSILKVYLGEQENIDWFANEVIELLGINPYEHEVSLIRNALLTKDTKQLFDGLIKIKRSGLIFFIKTGNGSDVTSKNNRVVLTVNSGIDKVTILNGEILIPVNDDDITKLNLSKGCSTILDGGYVWIDSIKPAHEITVDGFEKVGDISTEKY